MLLSSSVKYLCKITNFIFPPEKKIKSYIKKKKKTTPQGQIGIRIQYVSSPVDCRPNLWMNFKFYINFITDFFQHIYPKLVYLFIYLLIYLFSSHVLWLNEIHFLVSQTSPWLCTFLSLTTVIMVWCSSGSQEEATGQ